MFIYIISNGKRLVNGITRVSDWGSRLYMYGICLKAKIGNGRGQKHIIGRHRSNIYDLVRTRITRYNK